MEFTWNVAIRQVLCRCLNPNAKFKHLLLFMWLSDIHYLSQSSA